MTRAKRSQRGMPEPSQCVNLIDSDYYKDDPERMV